METPSHDDVSDEFIAHMMRVVTDLSRWINAIRDVEMPDGKIGYRQLHVLFLLRREVIPAERATPGALVEYLGVRPSVITGLVARLEEQGYLVRDADPHDRRRDLLRVTAKGKSISEQVEAYIGGDIRRELGRLSSAQRDELRRTIEVFDEMTQRLNRIRREQRIPVQPPGEA